MNEERVARDSMGEMRVPAEAYWDAQTARARDNFPISGMGPLPVFVWAGALVKWAAARANTDLGLLEPETGAAIMQAAEEVMAGDLADQFIVDVFQAGAGTSHHMNVNEVLASRASEILGGSRGDFSRVHPNDHVNYGQSTNDVIPTTIRVGAIRTTVTLLENLAALEEALADKGREFDDILKSGRTHLQDAVPIRLGQEFTAWATAIARSHEAIVKARVGCLELGIGGSAAGTGLNSHPDYPAKVCEALSEQTSENFHTAADLREAMQSMQPFVLLSGSLRALSVELSRICNDLRLLSSGPTTGLGEIRLPPVQPGSSIMPGKVNPVICEMVNQVCFQVMGNDHTVAMAAGAGQFELNVMMPVLGFNLLWSIEILSSAVVILTMKCITGIEADREQCERYAANTLGLATALNPCIGYNAAAEVVKEAQSSGRTIAEVVLEKGLMTKEEIAAFFDPHGMTEPGIPRCPDEGE